VLCRRNSVLELPAEMEKVTPAINTANENS